MAEQDMETKSQPPQSPTASWDDQRNHVLTRLETRCDLIFQKLDEKLDEQSKQMKEIEVKMTEIASDHKWIKWLLGISIVPLYTSLFKLLGLF